MKTNKLLISIFSTVLSLIIILTSLLLSIDFAVYSDISFYKKEYLKYNVLYNLDMNIDDALEVTDKMLLYLKGKRANLDNIVTTVDNQEREFFNQREKLHMIDVKNLFILSKIVRNISLAIIVISLILFIFIKTDIVFLCKIFRRCCIILLGLCLFLVSLASMNFTKYFTIFHKIFFSNDLWLLNPKTDLLINMLPEGFFIDMAVRIAIIFISSQLTLILLSTILEKRVKNTLFQ